MGVEKIYETDRQQDYAAAGHGQVVSRSMYAVVERGDQPLDGGFGEAEIVEIEPPSRQEDTAPIRVRVDTVPQDTIVVSPDAAATAAAVMQSLNNGDRGQLGFRVEYSAD
ncbi:MAG TPA: hypothetical protein VFH99_00220 [Candidatus Saccharimonadales bacterium]|nr:hypothetical protein [Candidatus Saccharimonadales bacterium]